MVIEEFTEDGFHVEISHDQYAPSPREDDDNLWTFVCWHRRYTLGDEKKPGWETPNDFRRWWTPRGGTGLLRPLFLYDHGGITISTGDFGDPWDSGQVGWAFVTRKDIRKHCGTGDEADQAALKRLSQEVGDYAMYLEGRIYEYRICLEGDDIDLDTVDSGHGIYGDTDAAAAEARASIKYTFLPQIQADNARELADAERVLAESLSSLP
jgi:hypothetical protein